MRAPDSTVHKPTPKTDIENTNHCALDDADAVGNVQRIVVRSQSHVRLLLAIRSAQPRSDKRV